MAGTKMTYEAPTVRFMKFDENDILRTSGNWGFNCQDSGQGNNMDFDSCDMSIHTDNSQN